MMGLTKFDTKKNREKILHLIHQQLYPETDYPKHLFPDLGTVLFKCFNDSLQQRNNQMFQCDNPEREDELEKIVIKILKFKNLLKNHPQTVILIYRTYIKKFIKYKHSGYDDWEDIYQEVITRLISEKVRRIQDKFDFSYKSENFSKKSFFTSYLMVTVRNIYMDIIRERKIRPLTSGEILPLDMVNDLYESESMLGNLVIDEECQKLHTLLLLNYKSRFKLELCLKLKCRIRLTQEEIYQCFPQASTEEIKVLKKDFRGIKDKNLFEEVIPIFNRHEGKESKSDTLRKWISLKIDEIVLHLNRSHKYKVYNIKNFMDILSLYFGRQREKESGIMKFPGSKIGDN